MAWPCNNENGGRDQVGDVHLLPADLIRRPTEEDADQARRPRQPDLPAWRRHTLYRRIPPNAKSPLARLVIADDLYSRTRDCTEFSSSQTFTDRTPLGAMKLPTTPNPGMLQDVTFAQTQQ